MRIPLYLCDFQISNSILWHSNVKGPNFITVSPLYASPSPSRLTFTLV